MNFPQSQTELPTVTPNALIVLGFLLTLWIATHPYLGIIHDARLYLLQSLHSLEPGEWNQDLFFRYGTQDSFTIFSNGYKWLITTLGINRANLITTLVGDALWLAGLGLLVCTVLGRPTERLATVCGALALNPGYGGLGIFHYAEPFVTPRLFVEAIVMGGLALAMQRRCIWTPILFLLALAIHPLIAIPGIGILAFHMLRRDPRIWTALGLAVAVSGICASFGIDPFTRVLEFYDANWFQIVKGRTDFALISAWTFGDYVKATSTFLILGIFLTMSSNRERKFVTSLMVVTIASLVTSFLGADLAHNVLVANLQLWRAMWFASLASNIAVILMILRSNGTNRIAFVIIATISLLSHFLFGPRVVAPFAIILCLLWPLHKTLPNRRARLGVAAMILILLAFTLTLTAYAFYVQVPVDRHIGLHLANLTLAIVSVLGLTQNARHPSGKWLIAVAVGSLITSVVLADQRTPWNRYVYGAGTDLGLNQFLANSGATYWEGTSGTEALWFKAKKPSYFSCLQGTESIFFRPQAMEWSRRQSALQHLNTEDFGNAPCGLKMDPTANGPNSPIQITAACQALPELDTIILNHPVPNLPSKSWTAPAYQEIFEHDPGTHNRHNRLVKVSTFYRYSCADLRKPLSK